MEGSKRGGSTTDRVSQAVASALDRARRSLDHAHGLKTVKLVVRISKQGHVSEIVLTPETSTAWAPPSGVRS